MISVMLWCCVNNIIENGGGMDPQPPLKSSTYYLICLFTFYYISYNFSGTTNNDSCCFISSIYNDNSRFANKMKNFVTVALTPTPPFQGDFSAVDTFYN